MSATEPQSGGQSADGAEPPTVPAARPPEADGPTPAGATRGRLPVWLAGGAVLGLVVVAAVALGAVPDLFSRVSIGQAEMGEPATDGEVAFTVTRGECLPSRGGQLCEIGVNVENTGNSTVSIGWCFTCSSRSDMFTLLVGDNRYQPEFGSRWTSGMGDIGPGLSQGLRLYFATPAGVTPDAIELHASPNSPGVVAQLDVEFPEGRRIAAEADEQGEDGATPADGLATDGGGDTGDGTGETTLLLMIATGGTGGVYSPLGRALAEELSEHIEGIEATAQVTSASIDNMLLIGTGDADLAFVLGDTAADAVEGRGADFEGNPINACTLGILYSNFTQLVTTPDSGITSVADLEGRRVSVGAPGSGTEVIALRILEAAGIHPDADIERSQLLIGGTVDGLLDGTIDAGFWSGGLPTGALVDLAAGGQLALVPTAEYTNDLADAYGPFYLEREIPADTYDGVDEAVPTIVLPNVLVATTAIPEDLQRQITEVLFEQKDDLVNVHPAAGELDAATAGEVEFMDVCPGAQSYYDEAG